MAKGGRALQEAGRLMLQAEVYGPLTRRFFHEAGIREGMRVLDVGSGAGDVSLLAAELVGPGGSVIGVEANAATLAIAVGRAQSAGKSNITFIHGEIQSAELPARLDAIVGRFVLRELGDAGSALRRLSRLLVPGGLIAFQEKVLCIPVRSYPSDGLAEKVRSWMDRARGAAGVEVTTGLRLPQIYAAAGLPVPQLRLEAPVGYGPEWVGYDYLAETLRGMLPLMRLYGIAEDGEIGIETLAARMRKEAAAPGSLVIGTPCMGAWAVRRGRRH
jgi:ubiquinone/menaquinone biosynthesis C-methylase UbiE